MKKMKIATAALVSVLLVLALVAPAMAQGSVAPSIVEADLEPGQSTEVEKAVTTPAIPPVVDVCLLEDETGSFGDDIENLQGGTTASDIYETIVAASPNAQFAVAGFRDYEPPYGSLGDWVYRKLSGLSPDKAAWLNGISLLTAGGGGDGPEAQYDAIVTATTDLSWRAEAQRVLIVATDASFHLPGDGKPHVNTQASTIAALNAQNIIVIGLKAPGAGGELDALAAATGGSVQPLSPSGEDIAEAILAGLEELTTDVWWEVSSDDGLTVELSPDVYYDVSGSSICTFMETISVANEAEPCTTLKATVTFYANEYPEEGEVIGTQEISIHVVPVPVDIDIKPGSYPNSINMKSKGVLPVAVLTTATIDAAMVDPATVEFNGVASPLRWTMEDVDYDGDMDLLFHFRTQETGLAVGDEVACLSGNFFDGRAFEGCDSVRILSK